MTYGDRMSEGYYITESVSPEELPETMELTDAMPSEIYVYGDVPPWLYQQFARERMLLGLHDWYFWLIMDPALDGEGKVMMVDFKPQALEARIRISSGAAEDTPLNRRAVYHEALHIGLAPLEGAADALLAGLSAPARAVGRAIWDDAVEQLIERLVRARAQLRHKEE